MIAVPFRVCLLVNFLFIPSFHLPHQPANTPLINPICPQNTLWQTLVLQNSQELQYLVLTNPKSPRQVGTGIHILWMHFRPHQMHEMQTFATSISERLSLTPAKMAEQIEVLFVGKTPQHSVRWGSQSPYGDGEGKRWGKFCPLYCVWERIRCDSACVCVVSNWEALYLYI